MIANGKTISIRGVGQVQFVTKKLDGQTSHVILKEVYYAPDLAVNLVSTNELDKAGLRELSENGQTIFFLGDKEVMCASKRNERWEMNWTPTKHAAHAVSIDDAIWHKRLCHLGHENLRKLNKLVKGFQYNSSNVNECDICNKGKITRRPFKTSTNPRAKYPLELLHMDVVIVNTRGRGGEMAVLVATDDYSGCRFSYPITNKSGKEILQVFEDWLPWAERMTDRKLKCIRHDNAKEFTHGVFVKKMKDMGVETQVSIPYEHEQNGTAERSNRVIFERARCILIESGLSKQFWPDSILTATYAINRSPYAGFNETPIERFTGIKPDLANLRVFGSWCWARISQEKLGNRNKLEP